MALGYPFSHGNGGMVQCLTLTHRHTYTQKNPFGPLTLMEDGKCAHCLMALIKLY